jgi:hypothetical protein
MKLSVQNTYSSVGPFELPDEFQNNRVGANARVGANNIGLRSAVATTAPVVDAMFLQNLAPKQAVTSSRLNIIA